MISVTQFEKEFNNRRMAARAYFREINWIQDEVGQWEHNRLVAFVTISYPKYYHLRDIRTDMTHFLNQVFQRCPRLKPDEADCKRIFWEEVCEGHSPHIHGIIQCPNMDPERFKFILKTRARYVLLDLDGLPVCSHLVDVQWAKNIQQVVQYCQKRNTIGSGETVRDHILKNSAERFGIRQSTLLFEDDAVGCVNGYSTSLCVLRR